MVANDAVAPTTQASVTTFTVAMVADTTPPSWISGYPTKTVTTDSSVGVTVRFNEAGVWAWVLVASTATAPSPAQVIASTDGDDTAAIANGQQNHEADTESSVTVAELSAQTSYTWYFIAADDESPPNWQAAATDLVHVTGGDVTPPTFTQWPLYPATSAVTDQGFTFKVSISEVGAVPWVLLPTGSAVPSVAQIAAATDGNGDAALVSGVVDCPDTSLQTTVVSGLSAATPYQLYMVPRDDESTPNYAASATVLSVVTGADVTPPSWPADPTTSAVTDAAFVVTAALSEPGTVYAVVVAASSSAPTAAQVVAGLAAVATPALAAVSAEFTDSAVSMQVPSVLSAATDYSVYVVGVDDEPVGNVMSAPFLVEVTTGNDATPPSWVTGFPRSPSVGDFSATIQAKLTEDSTVHWVLLPDGSVAPSAAAVRAGTDGVGTAGIAAGSLSASAGVAASATISSGLSASTAYVHAQVLCSTGVWEFMMVLCRGVQVRCVVHCPGCRRQLAIDARPGRSHDNR